MEQLIAKFQELVGEAKQLINQYKAKLVVLDDKEKLLEQEKSAYKILESDLNKREAEVNVIENISLARKECDTKANLLAQERTTLDEEKKKFETYKAEHLALLDTRKLDLDEVEKNLTIKESGMEEKMNKKLEEILKNAKVTIQK